MIAFASGKNFQWQINQQRQIFFFKGCSFIFPCMYFKIVWFFSLANWLSWLEHRPMHHKVAGSILVRVHT